MSTRESDARNELEEARAPRPVYYKDVTTGTEIDPGRVALIRDARGIDKTFRAPPVLTEAETQQASQALRELYEAGQLRYPQLTRSLLQNPDYIWLFSELQLQMSPTPDPVSYDIVSDVTEGLLADHATPGTIATYHLDVKPTATQQLFWQEVGNLYDEGARDQFISVLSQLEPESANRVASLATVWAKERDMKDEENQAQLRLNIISWSFQERQSELGATGIFGLLDAGQEIVEGVAEGLVTGALNLFGSAEEAARRRHLTLGQNLAYQFGLRPPDEAGEFGAWNILSGGADAVTELALDPLAWAAGVGAGIKAVRTVPLAANAVNRGRAAMAARALLPRFFTGHARNIRGGRAARVIYSLRAKPFDDAVNALATNGVAEAALGIIKSDNPVEFSRRFPQWARMSDDMWEIMREQVETPEEFVQVLKSGALNDALNHADTVGDAEKAAAEGWASVRQVLGEDAPEDISQLMTSNAPRELLLEAASRQLRVDALKATPSRAFIISDLPEKVNALPKMQRIFDNIESPGRFATGTRRLIARATPGRPPDEIEIFNTRKATTQLNQLFEHFGMRREKIDGLLNEFRDLELGARQDWFWDKAIRGLGEEIGVPVFQHNLITFFRKGGVRKFSATDGDLWVDTVGRAHRMPIFSNQMRATMPIPLDELDEVVRRSRSIGERSRVARAMGWNGRGIGPTNRRRSELVGQLRNKLTRQGADQMDDEALWDMAFSMVSPHGIDGRGWWAGRMMPKAGSVLNQLHRFFTKSMLVFRPIQWMWRVAILEEPIRSHMFNLPSLYTNPLQYMAAGREAYHISRLTGWREANLSWAHDAYRTLTAGTDKAGLLGRLENNGLLREVFPDGAPDNFFAIKRGVADFIKDATFSRTRLNKLNPIKRAPYLVRRRGRKIERAESMLEKLGLPSKFDLVDDVPEIQQKILKGYLGDAVGGSSGVRTYQWADAMTEPEAYTHGQVYGAKIIEALEDPFGRLAIRRLAADLRSVEPSAASSLEAVVGHFHWELMRHDLRLRFPDAADDLALAERYMDDILRPEMEHLFEPWIASRSADEAGELLSELAQTRRLQTTLGGVDVDIDFRGANHGGATRAMGDLERELAADIGVKFPTDLPAPSLDPRFMAHDEAGWFKKSSDWILQTFGERATQELNRRPAFLREYSRWHKHYTGIGIPDELAAGLAKDHAAQMVNHVFFNMDEAPYLAAKLNNYIPFFGATYEVLSTWLYKMPVAVGGYWPTGVGEFARKFDRLLDAFVNTGLVAREEEEDGTTRYTLNLVPPDTPGMHPNEIGEFFRGAGYNAVNTLEHTIATVLRLQEGLDLRDQGYRLAVGNPLNFRDFGILSFAQANIGLNPHTNLAISALGGLIPKAADGSRTLPMEGGETLAAMADRLDVDINELVRLNRGAFVDSDDLGSDLYNAVLAGRADPTEIEMPEGLAIEIPDTSLWDNLTRDILQPFGDVDSLHEFGLNFMPGTMRWALAGLAIQNQPTDEFYKGEYGGIFGGILPSVNKAQVSSQISEAFMYVESHDLVNGVGPFARIQKKREQYESLKGQGSLEAANKLLTEIELDERAFLERVQRMAADSLILRSLTGQMLPTSPGHVRTEQAMINDYWASRDYADSLRIGDGELTIRPFASIEEADAFQEQVAAWLNDATGDEARATFRRNYPQLLAYLTPKTFWSEGQAPSGVTSYDEYVEQIESGEREAAPLQVTMARAQSSAIQADHYNEYVARFGTDPLEAAANALRDRGAWKDMNDQRNLAYQVLYMQDDMNGHVYQDWLRDNFPDENTALEQEIEKLNTIRDNLGLVLELDDALDSEVDLAGITELNSSVRAAIAEISGAIRDYNDFTEQADFRNPYEKAINQYFEEVYIPYQEQISALYDQLPVVADSERQSLIYEQIKMFRNRIAGTDVFLGGENTIPFPNPLEYSWSGKSPEEQAIKRQQWLTRPLEWIDQDQVIRITDHNRDMGAFMPKTDDDFRIYNEWTLNKLTVDEMLEANEITSGQARKMRDQMEEEVKLKLVEMGRGAEVEFMGMTPFEKLEIAGELPANIGILAPHVRWYKEVLAAEEESAGTARGRQIVAPFYDMVEQQFFSDPNFRSTMQELSINLQDEDQLDSFMPWIFFGHTVER